MYTKLAYIYEGEILGVRERAENERNVIRYTCRITMENGSDLVLPNVIEMTPFGGIGDYMRRRSRTSFDAEDTGDIGLAQTNLNATIGERVFISFVGGNILYPVIVGYAQHPNQTDEFDGKKPTELSPELILQYLGIRIEVGDEGQIRFIHKGAPQVNYHPKPASPIGAGLETAAGLLSEEPAIGGDDNPALEPASEENITLWEMLQDGVYRIRDAEGQIIEIDRTKKRIYISNNDLKSTEDSGDGASSGGLQVESNSTDAEYVLLDKDKELVLINARQIAQIYSFDRRKDVTEGLHQHKVGGNNVWIIGGNETVDISGDRTHTVEGNDKTTVKGDSLREISGGSSDSIGGDKKSEVKGGWSVDVAGDINFTASNGQAGMNLKGGKFAVGNSAAELMDLFDQTIEKFDIVLSHIQMLTVSTLLGPSGVPINLADFINDRAELNKIKVLLGQIKGSL